jgi:ppGpp synthetase/RelA/SpoT-type nucleotidyltranferase
MPEVEARVGAAPTDQVLAEFERRRDHFEDLKNETERLIGRILKEEGIGFQSVQSRVKRREKLKIKYSSPKKDYTCLDEIPDLVGFRIITYYSDTLDRVLAVLEKEFAECGPREDKRIGAPDSFGYSAIHVDCKYSEESLRRTEYKRFTGARFEVQITTVLGHAWAEMQHPWYDEADPPIEEKRRFHRLAAVLELAEQEFLDVRKQKENRERVAKVRVEAKAPEIPITQESLKAFVEQGNISEFDREAGAILIGDSATPTPSNLTLLLSVTQGVGISTIKQLEDKLRVYHDAIMKFITLSAPIWDAARPASTIHYTAGLCILHLAYLLGASEGEQNYLALLDKAGLTPFPGTDIGAITRIAKEVLAAH